MSNENKPDMTSGTFAWNELAATDPAKCESFYHGAVWPAGPENGRLWTTPVAEMMKKPEQCDLPPFWLSYINVSDVNAMRKKAIDNGAEALTDVVERPSMGSFAVIKDPTNPTFALWQGVS